MLGRRPTGVTPTTKRAWTLWKTAENAVSHSVHARHLGRRTQKNEDERHRQT